MLIHYLTVAMRNLRKYKAQNIINIIGLSVSIACFTLCFYVVRNFTSIDKDIPNVDKIYTLYDSIENYAVHDPFAGNHIAQSFPEVEKYATIEFHRQMMFESGNGKDNKYMMNMLEVTPSFFDFFSVDFVTYPQAGYETQRNGIVMCESAAIRLFGTVDVNGKTLTAERDYFDMEQLKSVKQNYTYTVHGVIKNFNTNSYFNISAGGNIDALFINDERGNLQPGSDNGWTSAKTAIMLHKGVSIDNFSKKIKNYPKTSSSGSHFRAKSYHLIPFSITLKQLWGNTFYVIIGIFGGLGVLILLVSIFNYASYSINTFLNKRHECAIRKTANAGYRHLFFLFFTETAIIIIMSGIVAVCWIQLLTPFVNRLFTMFFTLDTGTIYLQVLQYVVLGLLLTGALYAIPVKRINSKVVTDLFHGGNRRNPKSNVRNVLLGFQLFISIFFISGAMFMYLQLNYVESLTAGTMTKTEKENIFAIDLNHPLLSPHANNIIQKFKTNPAIEEMLLSNGKIVHTRTVTGLRYENNHLKHEDYGVMWTSHNYAQFTKTKILEGRFATENSNEMVINETAKKLLGKENVLGEIIHNYEKSYTIVGVMEDVLTVSASNEIRALFLMPYRDDSGHFIYAKVTPAQKKETRKYILQTIREYLPSTIEYNIPTLAETISDISGITRVFFKLIFLFAVISIIISLFGIYSSVVLATERRRKEVAIRKINGASLNDIIGLFLRKYLYILVVAAVPAFAIVYIAVGKWLETYVYRISVSWVTFAIIFIALICLLILTVIYQLVKTARLNPAQVVKS
jgi:ABC-type antimicrobial peptide transport system permease subunit